MKEKGCFQYSNLQYSNLHKSPCLRCFCLVSFVLQIQGQPLQGVFCGGQAIRKPLNSSRMRNIEPAPPPAPPPPVTTTAVLFRFVSQPSPKGPWFVTTTIHSATPREVRHRKSSALRKIVSPVLSRSRESHANVASWEMRSCDWYYHTLRKFNSSPLKSYLPKRKVVFQPPFFRSYVKLREVTLGSITCCFFFVSEDDEPCSCWGWWQVKILLEASLVWHREEKEKCWPFGTERKKKNVDQRLSALPYFPIHLWVMRIKCNILPTNHRPYQRKHASPMNNNKVSYRSCRLIPMTVKCLSTSFLRQHVPNYDSTVIFLASCPEPHHDPFPNRDSLQLLQSMQCVAQSYGWNVCEFPVAEESPCREFPETHISATTNWPPSLPPN